MYTLNRRSRSVAVSFGFIFFASIKLMPILESLLSVSTTDKSLFTYWMLGVKLYRLVIN